MRTALVGLLLVTAMAAGPSGCAYFGGGGGGGGAGADRNRGGLADRSAGRTTARAWGGEPQPGKLVAAPEGLPGLPAEAGRPLAERATIRLDGPVDGRPVTEEMVVDPTLPRYRPGSNLNGLVRTVGSSTLTTLVGRWSEEFERIQSRIRLDITGGGSFAAVRPFVAGESDLAPMAREMNARELASFKERWGYEPTRFTVALDAVAVYVNKNNPVKQLTLAQLDAIYGIEPARGARAIATWAELGVAGELARQPVNRYGPRRGQGIWSVFRERVLSDGGYTLEMRSEPVSSAVVQSAGADNAGIAFASRIFATQRTRIVPIAASADAAPVLPDARQITSGRYPLTRRLFLYANKPPGGALPLHVAEFLRYVCSYEGQQKLAEEGGVALTKAIGDAECAGRI